MAVGDSKETSTHANAPAAEKKKGKKEKEEPELSEEDLKLKTDLELLVTRTLEGDAGVQKLALERMRAEIKNSTSSMTSVPKPLKFLRPHYETLKKYFAEHEDCPNRALLSDILSVLAMTMGAEGAFESLHYRKSGSQDDIGSWGHEYVRNLAGEITQLFSVRTEAEESVDDLLQLVAEIVPYHMTHNAEHEACDLLMEVGRIGDIVSHTDAKNHPRVCLYLIGCASYVPEPEDSQILRVASDIYRKEGRFADALRLALRLQDNTLAEEIFNACEDFSVKKQLAFMLASQGVVINLPEEDSDLSAILSNATLSDRFIQLARDLDVMEAKVPEDIYAKGVTTQATGQDAAKLNAANMIVNGLLNAGFREDKLIQSEASKQISRCKETGIMSAVASIGLIHLWDAENGINIMDSYLSSKDNYAVAGAAIATGIINCYRHDEVGIALGVLTDYLAPTKHDNVRIGALIGLGIAYAGTNNEAAIEIILPIVEDTTTAADVVAFACLSLGFICIGTCNGELATSLAQVLMDRPEKAFTDSSYRYLCLGLGLIYLGRQDNCEISLEVLRAVEGAVGEYARLTLETCAYFGTGNVLKVQQLLAVCSEQGEQNSIKSGLAVLGIAMIAVSEDIGSEMALRSFGHLLQYGDVEIKRAVPLALALLCVSNPKLPVMDTLSKLTHDADPQVSQNALFALGLLGAGTNNSRVANLLRQLASFYSRDPSHTFLVRLAQGMLHMGKGTLTLSLNHSDRLLPSFVGIAGILTVLHAALDMSKTILGRHHYILYYLACTIRPRMLVTLDESLNQVVVNVRVGQAVDTVGQAGRPKTITGFQTHTTPVLLNHGERAELATDEYEPLTSVLEGFVILRRKTPSTSVFQ
eukprot:TRINITY_DN1828_c0_g2_i1.p1 TRINITY_DN1828_c0_g2~~TRINITY_DN1828_c0_g2_i1.p1  ORF type:complete len:870 (-),score=207.08 TRINITY_DN1828_c0_g2_i1:486-3095(-)